MRRVIVVELNVGCFGVVGTAGATARTTDLGAATGLTVGFAAAGLGAGLGTGVGAGRGRVPDPAPGACTFG